MSDPVSPYQGAVPKPVLDGNEEIEIASGSTVTKTTTQEIANLAASGGGIFSYATKIANYAVRAADNLTIFDNGGAAGEVDFTLPAYAVGLDFGFVVMAAQVLKIIAPPGVSIALGNVNSAAGGNVQSSTPNSSIAIAALKNGGVTTQWVAVSSTGIWTVT